MPLRELAWPRSRLSSSQANMPCMEKLEPGQAVLAVGQELQPRTGWALYGTSGRSNRLVPGVQRMRQGHDPAEAFKAIKFMKEARTGCAGKQRYWRSMVRRYRPNTNTVLQDMLANAVIFKPKVNEQALRQPRWATAGHKLAKLARANACALIQHTSTGCRAPGGGMT